MKNVKQAPGAPGVVPRWVTSATSGVGKAINPDFEVTSILSHGILYEILFPREDIASIRDMEFLVTDGKALLSEEKRDADQSVSTIKTGIPAYKIKNTCKQNRYMITKEIVCDLLRNPVLQKIRFSPGKKNNDKLHLYAILAPHLNDQGAENEGCTDSHKGIPMLFAENGGLTLALACSVGWLKRSVGYVGMFDGWIDLHEHYTMKSHFKYRNLAICISAA